MQQEIVNFLVGSSYLSTEMQALWMAIQGAMKVRQGPNQGRKLHWFHAFTLSVLVGFAGGMFGFLWMGKPSSMLSNDLNLGSCILAFILVNYTPWDIGYKLLDTLPLTVLTTSYAQLFRATGLVRFVATCFNTFKDTPSEYYPIPVFGPIFYAILLGNMGGIFAKGVEGHVANGMPWPVQNGIFCASFYHFFVNDKTGPVGTYLRAAIPYRLGLDDQTFAAASISLFMQIFGILQLPAFFGPSFSPFGVQILSPFMDSTTWTVGKTDTKYTARRKAQAVAKKNKAKKS